MADSLQLPMIQVRAADILDKWLGGSEALLRSLFSRARAASPCILFLDEIDAIANNREEDDTNDFTSRILSTLLNEMDGVSSAIQKSRVLVVACTNRLGSLDSALLRPGRLQEHFYLQ
jgi:SpoVK/Ycf46/Vps4 family AAA+-type ATPase